VVKEVTNPMENICEKLTHVHKLVNTWWCWHICKDEEVGEEEEAKPSSGCYLGGTGIPCPVAPPPLGRCPHNLSREGVLGLAPMCLVQWHRHP
jgi:hypothetical protein